MPRSAASAAPAQPRGEAAFRRLVDHARDEAGRSDSLRRPQFGRGVERADATARRRPGRATVSAPAARSTRRKATTRFETPVRHTLSEEHAYEVERNPERRRAATCQQCSMCGARRHGEVREVLLPFLWRNEFDESAARGLRPRPKMLTDKPGVHFVDDAAASEGERVETIRTADGRATQRFLDRHWSVARTAGALPHY